MKATLDGRAIAPPNETVNPETKPTPKTEHSITTDSTKISDRKASKSDKNHFQVSSDLTYDQFTKKLTPRITKLTITTAKKNNLFKSADDLLKIFKECEHLSTMTIGGCHLDTKAFCEQKDFIFIKEEIAIADGHLIEHTLTKKTELSIRSDLTLKDLYEIMTPFVKTLTIESGKEPYKSESWA